MVVERAGSAVEAFRKQYSKEKNRHLKKKKNKKRRFAYDTLLDLAHVVFT